MQSQRFIADKKSSFLTSVSHYEFQKKLGYQDDTGFKNYHGNILATAICDESHSIFIEFEHQLIILNKDLSERKKINFAPSEATLSLMPYNQGNDVLFCKRGCLKSLNIETETWRTIYEYKVDYSLIKHPQILGCQNNIALLAIHSLRGISIKSISIDSGHIETEWMLPLTSMHNIQLSQDKSFLIHSFESYTQNCFHINIYDIKTQTLQNPITFENKPAYTKVRLSHDNSLLIISMGTEITIYDISKKCMSDTKFYGSNFHLSYDNQYLFFLNPNLFIFDLKNNKYIETKTELSTSYLGEIFLNEEDEKILILDKMKLDLFHYNGSKTKSSLYACLLFELAAKDENSPMHSLCPDTKNMIFYFIFKLNLAYVPIINLAGLFKDKLNDIFETKPKTSQLGFYAPKTNGDDIVLSAFTNNTFNK